MFEKYKNLVDTSFTNAENKCSKITDDILNLSGMTGVKTRHFYNNLLNTDDARYLEIGTWAGSSVCSAMYKNNAKIFCIDNWSEFGGPANEFFMNISKFKGKNKVEFLESDCFKVDISKMPKFNIYMYDGCHDFEDQSKALTYYIDCLDDLFIYVIDDWNHESVRGGTRDAISKLNLDVLYEREIRLTWDDTHSPMQEAKETWWNGIGVMILQKSIKKD